MYKKLLLENEVPSMIRKCYESDASFIQNYHELAGQSVDICVERTIKDFKNSKVQVFGLYKNDNLVGYFGDNGYSWLTGFFILPEYRKYKKECWNIIDEYFNYNFQIGILTKNMPAIKFFKDNNCKFSHFEPSIDGLGMIFVKENN